MLALAFRCLVDLFAASVVALILTSDLESSPGPADAVGFVHPYQAWLLQGAGLMGIGGWGGHGQMYASNCTPVELPARD